MSTVAAATTVVTAAIATEETAVIAMVETAVMATDESVGETAVMAKYAPYVDCPDYRVYRDGRIVWTKDGAEKVIVTMESKIHGCTYVAFRFPDAQVLKRGKKQLVMLKKVVYEAYFEPTGKKTISMRDKNCVTVPSTTCSSPIRTRWTLR